MADSPAVARPSRSPWAWIPSLYFAEGLPYVVVMTVAVIMYKRLGVSNTDIALYTSWLYLPWVVKPLWSPLVEATGTRRRWIVLTQLLVGAGLAGTAAALPGERFLGLTLATLTFVAFSSATHDVAADGFYMLGLDEHRQAWFVGVRNTCYRLAMIAGQGLLVMLAGALETATGLPPARVEVSAADDAASAVLFDPAAASAALAAAAEAATEQRIVTQSASLRMGWGDRPAAEAADLIAAVRAWNAAHGFTAAPGSAPPPGSGGSSASSAADGRPTWKQRAEDALRGWFGPATAPAAAAENLAGDVTVVAMRAARPLAAGEQISAVFARESGDASFRVAEGERFAIAADNDDQPFFAVVQADRQLRQASSAGFAIRAGHLPLAWSIAFYLLAGFFGAVALYHQTLLPRPANDRPQRAGNLWSGLVAPVASFVRKPRIGAILAFLLLYRFAESQLVKLAAPFLLDAREEGGLALSTGEVGFVYGTMGVLMLTLGGLLGGFAVARHGLRRWLWPMALAINVPNLAYVYLSAWRPESLGAINAAVAIEQFGYGFGFTAFMVYCLYVAQGEHQTVHYAFCTGFMALGMMVPGMWSGWLQHVLGYERFFAWVVLATAVSFAATAAIPLDADFGRRREAESQESDA